MPQDCDTQDLSKPAMYLHPFNHTMVCCYMKWSPAVCSPRIDICASVEEDLRQRLFLNRRRRRISTDLHGFRVSTLYCLMKRSIAIPRRHFDICASIEEDLRRRPFPTRQKKNSRRLTFTASLFSNTTAVCRGVNP